MAERITRPPIRLGAGLPDGQLLGATTDDVNGFLVDNPDGQIIDRYALVRLIRRQTVHSDETGADVAVLRVAAIELLPNDVVHVQTDGGKQGAAELIAELRAARLGENVLDFAGAAASQSLTELRDAVQLWANEAEVPPEELADEIRKIVPNIPDGLDVLRDARILSEFLTAVREREDDAFDAAIEQNAKATGGKGKRPRKLAAAPAPAFTDGDDDAASTV